MKYPKRVTRMATIAALIAAAIILFIKGLNAAGTIALLLLSIPVFAKTLFYKILKGAGMQ